MLVTGLVCNSNCSVVCVCLFILWFLHILCALKLMLCQCVHNCVVRQCLVAPAMKCRCVCISAACGLQRVALENTVVSVLLFLYCRRKTVGTWCPLHVYVRVFKCLQLCSFTCAGCIDLSNLVTGPTTTPWHHPLCKRAFLLLAESLATRPLFSLFLRHYDDA